MTLAFITVLAFSSYDECVLFTIKHLRPEMVMMCEKIETQGPFISLRPKMRPNQ